MEKESKLGASTERFQYILIYIQGTAPWSSKNLTKELHVSGEMAEQGAPTASIGIYLKEKYGSKPPDTHIGCFYIKLGQEICQYPKILQQAIATLKSILGPTVWGKTESGWDGVFFFNANNK